MNNMGEMFKELRTARNISLKEATGGAFSYSMLSKFENGESDITVSKLLIALENIRTELTEFVYLVRGFQPTAYHQLKTKIWDTKKNRGLSSLQQLYDEEQRLYEQTHQKQHLLNALVIKTHVLFLDEQAEASQAELAFLYDYLFSVDIWGEYELKIFSDLAVLLPLDLYFRYTREMLQKVDFLGELPSNRNYIHTILLNGLFKAIDEKKLSKAAYFDKQIQSVFFEENETYLRIVYRFADGQHDCLRGEVTRGLQKMQEAIDIFKMLSCEESADYYEMHLKDYRRLFE